MEERKGSLKVDSGAVDCNDDGDFDRASSSHLEEPESNAGSSRRGGGPNRHSMLHTGKKFARTVEDDELNNRASDAKLDAPDVASDSEKMIEGTSSEKPRD